MATHPFYKLLREIGEEEMLAKCYEFMTLSTIRPTEEQRQFLESKFEQDRRYMELRSKPVIAKCRVCHQELEDICSCCDKPLSEEDEPICNDCAENEKTEIVEIELPKVPEEPKPKAERPPKEAERNWPAMRAKRFIKVIDPTYEKKRINHLTAVSLLAEKAGCTLDVLYSMTPSAYLERIKSPYLTYQLKTGRYANSY